ncbi:PQQ-binding-like beta-propeller repeat protein [Polymorphospora rubra]|uniref:Pyrrolo-quinoline quinone repeat domain-containing protein n=1 Tax=Polymorphospora rubra TaxID=338584 RepID=A0A810N825_9ACTN|nr:PQQ-binding-like beta-propeller repeat protein [Polymorphospora rubra]BCJ69971.1 hypothetical protein Prubr_69920 [Polymorphospora rubra]
MSTVIDLGVRPVRREWTGRSRRPAVRHRRTVLAGLAALLVLATGGGAPPPEPAFAEVATVPISPMHHYVLAGDALYSAELDLATARRVVTAYDLRTGTVRWTSPVGPSSASDRLGLNVELAVWPGGTQLLVGNNDEFTSGVDPETGEVRWSTRPAIIFSSGGVGLGEDDGPPGHRPSPGSGPAGRFMRGVDLDTGRELWAMESVIAGRFAAGATGTVLVVETMGPGIEVRDVRTGAVRATLPTRPGELVIDGGSVGDLLIVHHEEALAGYAVDTLEQRWRVARPGLAFAAPCGPHVCLHGKNRLTVLDPADGTELGGFPVDGSTQVLAGDRAGHLLVLERIDDRPWSHRLVDRYGRTLLDLPGWEGTAAADDGARQVLVQVDDVWRWSSFALLESESASLRFLGSVPYPVEDCRSNRTYVACQVDRDTVRVWRYR